MLITKEVETSWCPANKDHLISKGYVFTKMKDKIKVKIEDLSKSSKIKVQVLCDYCLEKGIETIMNPSFGSYNDSHKKYPVHKDSCVNCRYIKRKECNIIKYGVESTAVLPETREKFRQTCIDKYGVDNPNKNREIRKKTEKTNILKYGFVNPILNEEVKKKKDETIKIKYGVDNISQLEEIKNKKKETCLESLGVEYPTQNKDVVNLVMKNKAKTLYKNGTAPCSSQQLYINEIINGILNYPIGHYNLDILLDDKIYVECDFSGHDLSLKMGQISQKDFDKKEKYRYYYLKNRGYKMIKIISVRDYIPIDNDVIHKIITYAKEWFDKNHSWIKFDIDNKNVITSQGISKYDYGKLKRITSENYTKIITSN